MYIKRHLEAEVLKASKNYPVVMVCGQRQVGKSTMLNHIREPERRYVTFDDVNARRLAETDAELFFETYGTRLLIDEVQRVPEIMLEIKRIVDQKALNGEDNSGMFWLTGSQKFRMMKNVSESLAGRVAVFDMASLSSAEIEGRPFRIFSSEIDSLKETEKTAVKKDVHEIYKQIFRGGMPKLVTSDIERDRYYSDYVNTYLERDIKGLAQVGKLGEFYDFLVLLAARTAQELKYDELAKAIGVSAPTVKNWVSILEQSGVIVTVRPYASTLSKRLVKTPKVYFTDTGLCAYLSRWPSPETLENGAADGAFLETYVVSELLKSYYNAGKTNDLYYYRDVDKREIDLLIEQAGKLYPIEIKKSKNPAHPDKNFAVLNVFKKQVAPAIVVCMSDSLIPYSRNVWLCPVSLI